MSDAPPTHARCARCNYNLQGLARNQRCPECGSRARIGPAGRPPVWQVVRLLLIAFAPPAAAVVGAVVLSAVNPSYRVDWEAGFLWLLLILGVTIGHCAFLGACASEWKGPNPGAGVVLGLFFGALTFMVDIIVFSVLLSLLSH